MDLARELSLLAEHVEWPATPEPRAVPERAARALPRRRRLLAATVALAVAAALAAAFAVPGSRSAILRFLHLRGVTIERVDSLPSVEQRPFSADIGPVVTLGVARAALGRALLVPKLDGSPRFHLREGPVVSLVFAYDGATVLLTEVPFTGGFIKKFLGGATIVESVRIRGRSGFWLSGQVHDFFLSGAKPRLAGNVLVWEGQVATYRLEGRTLSKDTAVHLAGSLVRG